MRALSPERVPTVVAQQWLRPRERRLVSVPALYRPARLLRSRLGPLNGVPHGTLRSGRAYPLAAEERHAKTCFCSSDRTCRSWMSD